MDNARLALPLFGDEVAPRFCFAEEFLVIDLVGGSPAASQRLSMGDAAGPQRLAELAATGVTVLLCGGFNRRFLPLAASHQIQVIWGLVGRAERLVQAYCDGQLDRFRLCPRPGRGAGPRWAQQVPGDPRWWGSGKHGGRRGGGGRGRGHGPGGHRR